LALDSARPALLPPSLFPRLSEFAVFAFCAEMIRLASHCDCRLSLPVEAMAQMVPSAATSVPHIWLSSGKPGLSAVTL